MTTTSKQLQKILKEASRLNNPRKEFFQAWLRDHFGFCESERIELHLGTLEPNIVVSEIGIVSQEYEWCRDASLERIQGLI